MIDKMVYDEKQFPRAPGQKTASKPGELWGWPDKEAEMAYVRRWAKEFDEYNIGNATATSQVVQYPEFGLQCVQVEVWSRM